MTAPWFSAHTHSVFSANDALPSVRQVVARAVELGYPALGLTDHRTVAGSVQLYRECRKAGINPIPGCEFNVAWDRSDGTRPATYHMCVLANSETGYRNLCRLSTLSHRQFHYIPVIDFGDIAELGAEGRLEGLSVTTGCYFGVAVQAMLGGGSALGVVTALARAFDECFVEVQAHGIDHGEGEPSEQEVVDHLVSVADRLGLPVIMTQDSHYLCPEDRVLHDAYKRITSWGDSEGAVFPGTGYHMVGLDWMRAHHEPDVVRRGLEGLGHLHRISNVVLPELEKYTLRMPHMGVRPQQALARRTRRALRIMTDNGELGADPVEWNARLAEELDVIRHSGFAPYLLLVGDVCAEMRARGIWYSARGSASGSLVCYLLGITSVDPVAWDLRFDRFLSRDRTKPPDVDLDMEHTRRDEILAWLSACYPVTHVGTWLTYSLTEKVDRFSGEVEQRGSLRVRYFASRRRRGEEPGEWADIPYDDQRTLLTLSDMNLVSGYGVNAAGIVLAPDDAAMAELPIAYVPSSKTEVTQFSKDDVEALGFVKLDMLGLKTLTAMHAVSDLVGVTPEQVPLDDAVVYRRLGKGETIGVFQLEGYASQRGVRQMKPRSIHHVIAAMALFRPAAMKSGATETYINRMHRKEPVPTYHQDIRDECSDTYMVLLYQEQVIGVLRRLGMETEDLNAMLKAVKASNAQVGDAAAVIAHHKQGLESLAVSRGWDDRDVAWLTDAIEAFAGYSFNKAHATSYGLTAYRSAWYAAHYPVQFWASMMTVFGDTRPEYPVQASKDGVKLARPHVNFSGVSFTPEPHEKRIRKGLLSIHGVGEKAALEIAANAPYTSLRDMGQRLSHKKVTGCKNLAAGKFDELVGVVAALDRVGALNGIPDEEE